MRVSATVRKVEREMSEFILNLSCPDRPGIVASVSNELYQRGFNIRESHQFGDLEAERFFMRVAVESAASFVSLDTFNESFGATAQAFNMTWRVHDKSIKPRVLLMVSKFDHCLVDLLYRSEIGSLEMDVIGVVSNHEDARERVQTSGIPFYYWPVSPETKGANEAKLNALIASEHIELIVLARYMQILSPEFAAQYPDRIINIHHSFLPSFKGAVPYSRAFERGVKMIGATAHFVTGDLDEGPIITQGVADIKHDMNVSDLIDVGRDVERRTLAQAIRLYTQRRILTNGIKTVVFQ